MALGVWLALAGVPAAAQGSNVDSTLDALRQQIDAAQKKHREGLDDAELLQLRTRLLAAQAQAEQAGAAAESQLAGVQARLAELGALTPGTKESPDIASQRAQLDKARSALDARDKLARLLVVESEQAAADILAQRRAQFQARLGERTNSILAPPFWADLHDEMPDDLARLTGLGRELRATIGATPAVVWVCALLTAVLLWSLRGVARRLVLRVISTRVPQGRLRRSLHAFSEVLLSAAVPGLSAQALHFGMVWSGPLPEASNSLLATLVGGVWFGGALSGLGRAILSPDHPSWRLASMPDAVALRLRWLPSQLAVIIVLAWLCERLSALINASLVTTVATNLIVSLALGLALALALMRTERLRRQALKAERQDSEKAEGDSHPTPPRSLWHSLWVGSSWLVLIASLVFLLVGYVALGNFIVKQVVWTAVVIGSVYLLSLLLDDIIMALLASAPSGAGDGERMEPRARDQAAVLLSGLGRAMLALVALMMLLAPFGEGPSELFRRAGQWQNGVSIGEVQLRPGAVLQAIAVLVLCLAVVNVVQRWFARAYLPTTRLEQGMQASVRSLFGYAGGVVAVALAMSSMGIGLERIAWVASALSVGIGFGLQAVVQNFVSGLILLAERPVKVGDWVSLGGVEGDIRRINMRATEIQMGDRSTVIVPNSEFITKTVRNVTHSNPLGLVQIKLPMPLSTDAQRVRDLMLAAFTAHRGVLPQPAPSVALDGIDGGRLVFNATGYVSSPRAAYNVRSELLFDVLARLRDAGLPMSTPQSVQISQTAPPAAAAVAAEDDAPR